MHLRLTLLGKTLLGDGDRDEQQPDQCPGHSGGRHEEIIEIGRRHPGILTPAPITGAGVCLNQLSVVGVTDHEAAGTAVASTSFSCSLVRRACQNPRPTSTDIEIAPMNDAIAPHSMIVPMVENA